MPRLPRLLRRYRALAATCAVTATVGALACKPDPTEPTASVAEQVADAAAVVAQTAAAVTGQDAPMADERDGESHVGFDTHTYPGDKTMRAWKQTPGSPYKWVGFYLPAPCHRDPSWSGKRQTLADMDWGMAVVYVGQQTWGRSPKVLSASAQAARERLLARQGKTCDATLLTADRGVRDADDAIARTAAEGFPEGTVVFLDLERMEKIPPAMRNYYRAWTQRMLANGRFRPGVYVHQHNADAIYADVKSLFDAAGVTDTPRVWVAGSRGFDEGKAPQDAGFAFAGAWQGLIDVGRSVANIRLPVDVSVSHWKSPSAPERELAD